MANITQAPGGGVVANGVVSYLPQCSADGYSDLSADQAAAFDPTSSDYYVVSRLGCMGHGRLHASDNV
mgnify:CR=1 FL=1